jgi:hypothetical protein
MKIKKYLVYIFFVFFGLAVPEVQAQANEDGRVLEPGKDISGKPFPELNQESKAEAQKTVWEHDLPFLAQRVIDKGFNLPLPYGASLIFFHQNQGLSLDSLSVAFSDTAPLKEVDFIDFSGMTVDNTSWQAKFDAWILPFLNAFITVGTVKGTGTVPISIANADLYNFFTPGICPGGGGGPGFCDGYITATAPIDYNGFNYGVGLLLATAYNDWFFAAPITYVITNVNVSDDDIRATSFIPRIGYNLRTARSGKFGFYLGANYLDTVISLTGHYSLPLANDPNVGQVVNVRYDLSQHPLDKWNTLVGINWELSNIWSIILEVGFAKNKENQTVNFSYRF